MSQSYDDWLADGPWNDPEFECPECGKPVRKEGDYCSGKCFEASLL